MIDFRYHLVSIVAVFLALAIGIVLGSTELQGTAYNILNSTTAKLQNELDQANSQLHAAQAQASVGDGYAQAVEPVVLHDLLAGQRLLIITEPGAPASVVAAISNAATAYAGATVTGQIALQNKFFDISDTTLDGLNQINRTMAATAGIKLDAGETYQQQAATVIAGEILTKSAGSPTGTQPTSTQPASTGSASTGSAASQSASTGSAASQSASTQSATSQSAVGQQDTTVQTMLETYAQAGFLSISGQPATQATLAVVVTPQTAPSDGSADQIDVLLVPLVEELATYSSATVVAGTSAGSGAGSPIAVLRSSNAANLVSTVDDADFVSGQSVVIQALALQLNGGKPGSYGIAANGASAVAPSPAPTPSVSASPSPTSSPQSTKKAKK